MGGCVGVWLGWRQKILFVQFFLKINPIDIPIYIKSLRKHILKIFKIGQVTQYHKECIFIFILKVDLKISPLLERLLYEKLSIYIIL